MVPAAQDEGDLSRGPGPGRSPGPVSARFFVARRKEWEAPGLFFARATGRNMER